MADIDPVDKIMDGAYQSLNAAHKAAKRLAISSTTKNDLHTVRMIASQAAQAAAEANQIIGILTQRP